MGRSFLFTPADSLHKMNKVPHSGADVVILDLEDAVTPPRKNEARQNVVQVLTEVNFGTVQRLVRINGPDTPFFADDLEAIAQTAPDGIVVPKVETAVALNHIHNTISTIDTQQKIRLFALVETALGIMNIKEIAQATPRLDGLLFGAEDLATNMGSTRTKAGWEIYYGRSVVATAAAAYNLQAIDTVYLDIHNRAGLTEEAAFARQLGFSGKMAIHPTQINIINHTFTPSPAEITKAEEIIAAYEIHKAEGHGVFVLHDKMVDMPLVLAAKRLLKQAHLA